MTALVEEDRGPEIPEKARPMAAIVVAPRPVLWIRSGLVLPLQHFHGWMANPHRHLSHQMIAVVKGEAKQCTLLWGCEKSEEAAKRIA